MRFRYALLYGLVVVLVGTPPLLAETSSTQDRTRAIEDMAKDGSGLKTLVVPEPGEVDISIRITPTPHTHELLVYADSGSFYRSSTITLDGEDSQRVHTFKWRGFPVGDYEVVGVLLDDEGAGEVVVRSALKVVAR